MRSKQFSASAPASFSVRPLQVIALVILASCLSNAQQAVNYATLTGRVEDASGASVAGASVTATNLDTNQRQTTATDAEGRYRFSHLTVGSYQVRVEHEGFTTQERQLTLTLGQALDLPLRLTVAGVTGNVDIDADVTRVRFNWPYVSIFERKFS